MVFLVVLVPVFVIVFALFMERLEHRLRRTSVSEADVQEFVAKARPEEVRTIFREGFSKALKKFRRRNKANRPSRRSARAARAARASGANHDSSTPGGGVNTP